MTAETSRSGSLTCTLADAAAAHERLAQGGVHGSVVIVP